MCIIDHDNKLIYIAIPKTGSTATLAFLKKIISDNSTVVVTTDNIGLNRHSTAKQISSIIENYSDYHSIAVIRNPYDWYVSWYTYRQRNNSKFSSKNMSFKTYLNKQPMKELLSWICDDNDNIIVDSIITYEDGIEHQLKSILSKIISQNIIFKMEKQNISKKRKHVDYKMYYNDETKQIVKNLQSKTLKRFGYQF